MTNKFTQKYATHMEKCMDSLEMAFARLRTDRASIGMVEHLMVGSYRSEVPLLQVARVIVTDARTITITPWEKDMVKHIEKAIMASGLKLTPNTTGVDIRLILPSMTEERRIELVKVIRADAERARIAIRNIRRDAIKETARDTLGGNRGRAAIQELTDQYIARIDELAAAREGGVLPQSTAGNKASSHHFSKK